MSKNELEALISLLNDPDDVVYKAVKNKLLGLGGSVLPELKSANNSSTDSVFLRQSSDIISEVEFSHIFSLFKEWVHSPSPNLIEGAFLVAKYIYPNIEYSQIMSEIDSISNNTWLENQQNLTPLERIKALNHVIYKLHNYKQHTGNLYEYKNLCINKVIENKQGSPVALAILYITIARKLGMPVFGINMPRNFLVAYIENTDNQSNIIGKKSGHIMFYTNPHQYGAIVTKQDILTFLAQQKMQAIPHFFEPCNDKIAVQRLLLNLFVTCKNNKDFKRTKEIKLFLQEFKNKLPDYNL